MNNVMPENTPVTANIIAGTKVHITPLDADYSKLQPVYALNWFNTRWLWLYNLYNFLAARSVLKVAGIPFFKARVDRTLYGQMENHRSVLLIVRYHGLDSFKRMLENRYFQIMSLLRGIAVKEFTFGLSSRVDVSDIDEFDAQTVIVDEGVYTIHHFRQADSGDNNISQEAQKIAKKFDVNLGFASYVSARLYSQQGEKAPVPVDTIMTGCLVFQADSQSKIDRMLETQAYKTLISNTDSSYIATLSRVF